MISPSTQKALIKIGLTGLCTVAFLSLFLYAKLDNYLQQFQWQKPLEIYTQGKRIHHGDMISPSRLALWLDKAGYNQTTSFSSSGQYISRSNLISWNSRSDESKIINVQFWNNQIEQIIESGESRDSITLPDVYVGSLFPNSKQQQQLVRLHDVPSHVLDAIIVSEDRDFYQHQGISLLGIFRAIWQNVTAGKVVQGGSTITQQLIKNQFFDHRQSYWRKIQEAFMALIIEQKLNKDQILEAYLNAIYFGQSTQGPVIGLNAASRYYFDKTPSQLDLNQSVSLAALIRGANYYHPVRHPERLRARRDRLLKQMVTYQRISPSEVDAVIGGDLPEVHQLRIIEQQAPYQSLVKQAIHQHNLNKTLSQEQIKLTLDPQIQALAQKSLQSSLKQFDDPLLKASLIAIDVQSGAILAMENGSTDAYDGFNYALHAKRQVGSIIKPFIYYIAVQNGKDWQHELMDMPFEIELKGGQIWRPQNFSLESAGPVTMHQALTKSLNLATARLCIQQDITQLSSLLNRLITEKWFNPYPSLCLGATDLNVLQVSQLYQGLFNQGQYHKLHILQSEKQSKKPYVSLHSDAVASLNQTLHDITQQGTAAKIRWRLPNSITMGKTGTSDNQRDSWFAGMSTNSAHSFGIENGILVVVWAGYKDNSPTPYTGSSAALNIWIDFIKTLEAS
jgi:penicillin-binding protein 1B